MRFRFHSSQKSSAKGLTLIEILITIGIVSSVLLALTVMFGKSLGTVRKSKADSVSIFIAENVRARLLTDSEWPPGAMEQKFGREVDEHGVPTDTFVFDQLFFDEEGTEVAKDDPDNPASYQCILTFSRSPSYQSNRLDFIVLEVQPMPRGEPITFSFQRANNSPREAP